MIYLLHGDNTEASRNELIRLRENNPDAEYREIDGKTLDESAFVTALESHSLFGGKVLLVVERLLTSIGKKLALLKKIANRVHNLDADTIVIFWEEKKCSDSVVKAFGKVDVREFSYPKILFQYLDAINPSNPKQILSLLHILLKTDAPELILFMTEKRIRELIALKAHTNLTGLSPWQVSRLTSQNRAFTIDKLRAMHTTLTQAEYSLKTGTTPFDCSQLLKQFVIDELS